MPSPNQTKLTSGLKGGSSIPASSRFQLVERKKSCCFASLAPCRWLWQPSRSFTRFFNNCKENVRILVDFVTKGVLTC